MGKRKADEIGDAPLPTRRSLRQKTPNTPAKIDNKSSNAAKASSPNPKNSTKARSLTDGSKMKSSKSTIPKAKISKTAASQATNGSLERQYWLMKAEPESRFEKGIDIKFSIDDLAAKKEPEPWDGIRNFVARNNMRAMKKGDLAFFYHSSCKVPAIVGTMEIVQEHSPDLTAQDPKKPYYDPKDNKPDAPKWSVVHVEFREKFKTPIELTKLRELAAKADGLEGLQMLKQTRLSVSKVEPPEWEYLMRWSKEAENDMD